MSVQGQAVRELVLKCVRGPENGKQNLRLFVLDSLIQENAIAPLKVLLEEHSIDMLIYEPQ